MNDSNLNKLVVVLAIVFVCACAAIGFLLFPERGSTITKTDNGALNTLKLRARQAETSHDYEHEDACYLQALTEAKKSGTKTDVLEILSRLVRERVENHKLKEIDPFIEQALAIVKTLKGTSSYDPEMSVWMDDIADVLYARGEHTSNQQIKMYCARRYLDIELTTSDRFDPQMVSKAALLLASYRHQGLYPESASFGAENVQYLERTKGSDQLASSFAYFELGASNLMSGRFDEARRYLSKSANLHESASPDRVWRSLIDRDLSVILAMTGNLEKAKLLCRQTMDNHLKLVGHPSWMSALDAYVLASFEMQSNNLKEACTLYKDSLAGFQNEKDPQLSVGDNSIVDSGSVMALEALAKCEQSAGNKKNAAALLARAKGIRARHPAWACSKNPDPVRFFTVFGYLPYQVEAIPTKSDLPL